MSQPHCRGLPRMGANWPRRGECDASQTSGNRRFVMHHRRLFSTSTRPATAKWLWQGNVMMSCVTRTRTLQSQQNQHRPQKLIPQATTISIEEDPFTCVRHPPKPYVNGDFRPATITCHLEPVRQCPQTARLNTSSNEEHSDTALRQAEFLRSNCPVNILDAMAIGLEFTESQ
jgi:hypothetical protein